MEEFQSSGEKYKAFKDICKNASVEDWAALKNSEKKTYVCMKRKYDTMTRLGFMRPKNWNTKSPDDDSDEDQNTENQDESLQEASNKQLRKQPKVMAKNIAKGENDLKLLPVTRDSELAQKQLCPSGNARASGQQIQKSSGCISDPQLRSDTQYAFNNICEKKEGLNECLLSKEVGNLTLTVGGPRPKTRTSIWNVISARDNKQNLATLQEHRQRCELLAIKCTALE